MMIQKMKIIKKKPKNLISLKNQKNQVKMKEVMKMMTKKKVKKKKSKRILKRSQKIQKNRRPSSSKMKENIKNLLQLNPKL